MRIAGIDLDRHVLVIAEIGNNHEGSFELAQEMIRSAAGTGVDAVKFQTIVPERLVSADQTDRLTQLRKFQFSYEQFDGLKQTADDAGVLFLSTPFDIESAKFLDRLVPAFKIASGDNDFFPLLEAVALTGKPLIISTGLADLSQARRTVEFVKSVWQGEGIDQELAVLHCVVSYPTPPEAANLSAIAALKCLNVTVGYSDHTLGIEAAVVSVGAGARIIEKHFTIDKAYSQFRDHQLSADPAELRELVARVRQASALMGAAGKSVSEVERANLTPVRRSIAAGRDLAPGDVLRYDDLMWVRPGDGLRPGEEDAVVGRTVRRAIALGELIQADDLTEPVDS